MADAQFARRKRHAGAMPLPETVALVLQGGGALGSFQAGVFEALMGSAIELDWVAGISIGAVNAALIAGNPPEGRVAALRTFWNRLSSWLPSFPILGDERVREYLHEWSAGFVAAAGVPGFFRPRMMSPTLGRPGSAEALSFYDPSPLVATLDELVDWDLVNHGPVRLSVGAVDIESGNFRFFDTARERIDARHVMASGALPPGFPPVEIDGAWYWDGGLVSNTPLSYLLDEQQGEMLVFQVDLFAASAERPQTIMDVVAREKEIRFSSRTRQVSADALKMRNAREAVRALLDILPATLRETAAARKCAVLANDHPINLVQLIYRANAWEGGARDYEFSARTMLEHWQAGQAAVAETMANARLVAQNIATGKSAAFDLTTKGVAHVA
ncbi:MAG: patatin-like phospholipase family protein [Pseudomonadota bacterium]|nr:patatin-like phospholipase family protein [Pseudomonadota bacterium]